MQVPCKQYNDARSDAAAELKKKKKREKNEQRTCCHEVHLCNEQKAASEL